MAALPSEAAALAAVAALFFAAALCSVPNFLLTGRGFQLYIPLALASLFRGVAHAARASYSAAAAAAAASAPLLGSSPPGSSGSSSSSSLRPPPPNPDLLAVYGALNAAGFGISVAMCVCFALIWLRGAGVALLRPSVAAALRRGGPALAASVIVFGPLLGVIGAAVVYGSPPGDATALQHGLRIRAASASGFLAVCGLLLLLVAFLAGAFLRAVTRQSRSGWRSSSISAALPTPPPAAAAAVSHLATATQQHQHQQQEQPCHKDAAAAMPQQHDEAASAAPPLPLVRWSEDGLIVVLLGAAVLQTWCAAMRVAAVAAPSLTSPASLYYPSSVLPELLVAWLWALPTLAARTALGRRYRPWLATQQRRHGGGGAVAEEAGGSGSGGGGVGGKGASSCSEASVSAAAAAAAGGGSLAGSLDARADITGGPSLGSGQG